MDRAALRTDDPLPRRHQPHGYTGEYQDKYTITPEILEDLVRLEGMNLTQMQSQFTELSQHVREWSSFAQRFDEFMAGMPRHTGALERLAGSLTSRPEIDATPSLELRAVDLPTVKREILELFRRHRDERLFYRDLADRLRVDLALVIQASSEPGTPQLQALDQDLFEPVSEALAGRVRVLTVIDLKDLRG